ncbi:MAG TPA: Holliday junction branch migration protein RuvA [Fimbriimonas sp.]|nr:Holliday junction branch migration protein RuvA [Fimbriimonas sp.]
MIGRLRGELVELEGATALVEAGGVGYEVSVPDLVAVNLVVGTEVTLLTRQIFREDGVSLYGFLNAFQRRVFDLLLSVKGCGPKVGLALLGQIGEDGVASAIASQDARALTRASGVGVRLAERIILELKDKIQEETFNRRVLANATPAKKVRPADELVESLLGLGFKRLEAESAAEIARETESDVEEQLKHAVRVLTKK